MSREIKYPEKELLHYAHLTLIRQREHSMGSHPGYVEKKFKYTMEHSQANKTSSHICHANSYLFTFRHTLLLKHYFTFDIAMYTKFSTCIPIQAVFRFVLMIIQVTGAIVTLPKHENYLLAYAHCHMYLHQV